MNTVSNMLYNIFNFPLRLKWPMLHLNRSVDRRNDGCLIPTQDRSRLAEEGIQPKPDRSDQQPPRLGSGFPKAREGEMEFWQELVGSLNVLLVRGQ
jgi:hypothetical protein